LEKVIWSSASWKLTPRRLTVVFLSRKSGSKRMLTPEILASASKIFCRPWSGKLKVIGALLRGDSTGTG
jgi:hypothetical protein